MYIYIWKIKKKTFFAYFYCNCVWQSLLFLLNTIINLGQNFKMYKLYQFSIIYIYDIYIILYIYMIN